MAFPARPLYCLSDRYFRHPKANVRTLSRAPPRLEPERSVLHFDSPTHEPALTRRSRRQSTLPAGGESAVTPAADETPVAPLTRRAARAQMGIADSLLRVSVGIEDIEDLIEDFRQALG